MVIRYKTSVIFSVKITFCGNVSRVYASLSEASFVEMEFFEECEAGHCVKITHCISGISVGRLWQMAYVHLGTCSRADAASHCLLWVGKMTRHLDRLMLLGELKMWKER